MHTAINPATLFHLGNQLMEAGDAEAAIAAFERCRSVVPNHTGVLFNLGNALRAGGRPVDAVDVFAACLRTDPAFSPAYINLADALRKLTLLSQAREMAEIGLRHLPQEPEAAICLANILHDGSDFAAAAEHYRQALRVAPNHAGALTSLGNTLRALGQLTEALELHDRALAIDPNSADIHFNRAITLLTAGDFAEGWEEYEWRWRRSENRPRALGQPWQGEPVAGRTVLLHAEQGLGDTIQFIRYAPLVAELGARVVLEVQPPLLRLARQIPNIAHVLARGDTLPPFDVHCPLLGLPRLLTPTIDAVPNRVPYLSADQQSVATWQARLPRAPGLRVGLVWAGSPHADFASMHLVDKYRSIAVELLDPLADIQAIQWISLQQVRPVGCLSRLPLVDPMSEVVDFADTAALVASLDLVISVDTSVAHLAGAMGRPVWLLSRYGGCWRWLHERKDTPWYPTMRIFRQDRPCDWSSVVQRLRADLQKAAAAVVSPPYPRFDGRSFPLRRMQACPPLSAPPAVASIPLPKPHPLPA